MKILAFGITKELIGESVLQINDDSLQTVSMLKRHLEERYPKLKTLNSLAIAVNEEYASDEVIIESSDEIALIPPVSGG